MLTDIQSFFLSKCFLDYFQPLVYFHSSEKLLLIKFSSILVAFIKEWIFGGPFSIIPEVLLPIKFFLKYNMHKEKATNHKSSASDFLY